MFSDAATRQFAILALAVMAVGLAVRVERLRRKMGASLAQLPIYLFNLLMTRVRWRARIDGRVTVPRGGGAVIVCNHICPVDPAFIALACERPVHWMVAREYCQLPVVGFLLRILEVIPTGRKGIDTAAMKLAIRYAQQGELVGMFPEGRINDGDSFMLPGRDGAAMVALKARVPIVPCYIEDAPYDGTDFGFFTMTTQTRLKVGRPLDLSEYYGHDGDRDALKQVTRRLLREIATLAGRPDYKPELAGKGLREVEQLAG